MAERKARGRADEGGETDRCVFCRLSEHLGRDFVGRHEGVLNHLDNARREVLEAVREFVDDELERVEKALRERKRKRKRVTRIEVEP
jgi:hypothetical protein